MVASVIILPILFYETHLSFFLSESKVSVYLPENRISSGKDALDRRTFERASEMLVQMILSGY